MYTKFWTDEKYINSKKDICCKLPIVIFAVTQTVRNSIPSTTKDKNRPDKLHNLNLIIQTQIETDFKKLKTVFQKINRIKQYLLKKKTNNLTTR